MQKALPCARVTIPCPSRIRFSLATMPFELRLLSCISVNPITDATLSLPIVCSEGRGRGYYTLFIGISVLAWRIYFLSIILLCSNHKYI